MGGGRVYGADGAVRFARHHPHLYTSSWHCTLFHEEDALSNNPQVCDVCWQQPKCTDYK